MKYWYGFGAVLSATILGTTLGYLGSSFQDSTKTELASSQLELKLPQVVDKHSQWSVEQSISHQKALAKRRSQLQGQGQGGSSNSLISAAGGTLTGSWTPRGPYNQPGCWEMSAVNPNNNTVYGMTCAHYGGPQYIFKGTLAGDDFKLISGKFPNEYVDMFYVKAGSTDRLVVGVANGGVYYTDDDGATWNAATGFTGSVQSIAVNPQDNYSVWATNGQQVFKSSNGASFTQFQDFGSQTNARLYSPRFDEQPNSDQVYLAHGTTFYQLNSAKTQFQQQGTGAWPTTINKRFSIGGDSRKLYVTNHEKWYSSTNQGASWTLLPNSAWPGHSIAAHPSHPDTLTFGYLNPSFSHDGLQTIISENVWGGHQVWQTHGNYDPDTRHRFRIHADHQETQFFKDKDGQIFTLHSTDGGLMVSYKDWTYTSADWQSGSNGHYPEDTYYNITLFGVQTTEIYDQGMATGNLNPLDIVMGTQDQGTQAYENKSQDGLLYFKQSPYGDGPSFVSGNGQQFWRISSGSISSAQDFYENNVFVGVKRIHYGETHDIGSPGGEQFYPDLAMPAAKLWIKTDSRLAEVSYNGSFSQINHTPGSGKVQAFAQSAQQSSVLYTMQGGQVHRSSNSGSSWSSGTSTGLSTTDKKCEMAVSPQNSNHVLVACTTGSVYSTDGGSTWSNTLDKADGEVKNMVVHKDGNHYFIATTIGAQVYSVSNNRWYDLTAGTDIPWFNANNLEIVQDSIIRFGTWGLGIYDFTIYPPGDILQIEGGFEGQDFQVGDTVDIHWISNLSGRVKISLYEAGQLLHTFHEVDIDHGPVQAILPETSGDNFTIVIQSLSHPKNSESGVFSIRNRVEALDHGHHVFISTDSEMGDGPASNLFDGDLSTIWHSEWSPNQPVHPHEVVFRIDTNIQVAGLEYFPRTNSTNGNVADYEIYSSSNGSSWNLVKSGNIGYASSSYSLIFDQVQSHSYYKFVALSEWNNQAFASGAELRALYVNNPNIPVGLAESSTQYQSTILGEINLTHFEFNLALGEHATANVINIQGQHLQHLRLQGRSEPQLVEFKRPLSQDAHLLIIETSLGEKLVRLIPKI